MPALVHGPAIIRDIVTPIVARGHEVQLHIHTEWLAFARFNPAGRLTGRNIGDFPLGAQKKLIGLAADMLVRSEEHTSELQSLMRISYAVLCLKKKKNTTKT